MKNNTVADTIAMNFEEVRRRSIILWTGMPPELYNWRPDAKAFSCMEMIRHVLEGEHLYHLIINKRGDLPVDFVSPWKDRPFSDVKNELEFAEPFKKNFYETIREFKADDLNTIEISRKDKRTRTLNDFLNRCAYHEATHAGQFLSYFRTLGIDRPNIWD